MMKAIKEIKNIEFEYFNFSTFNMWLKYNRYFEGVKEETELKTIWYTFLLFHHGIYKYDSNFFIDFLDFKYIYTKKLVDLLIENNKRFFPNNNFIPDKEEDFFKKNYEKQLLWINKTNYLLIKSNNITDKSAEQLHYSESKMKFFEKIIKLMYHSFNKNKQPVIEKSFSCYVTSLDSIMKTKIPEGKIAFWDDENNNLKDIRKLSLVEQPIEVEY
jgi:hypothetical protein